MYPPLNPKLTAAAFDEAAALFGVSLKCPKTIDSDVQKAITHGFHNTIIYPR
jgi:hypothetical protein